MNRLDREQQRTERIRGTAKKLSKRVPSAPPGEELGDAEARARSLSDEVFWLRHALEVSKAGKEKLKARLAKLDAVEAAVRHRQIAQLRAALRRCRCQKRRCEALPRATPVCATVRVMETRTSGCG